MKLDEVLLSTAPSFGVLSDFLSVIARVLLSLLVLLASFVNIARDNCTAI